MDRIFAMQVFVAVAEQGGFAAASRELGTSPPVVSRTIAALESHLNVVLFHRSTRHVGLTEPGERYLNDCKQILGDIRAAEDALGGIVGEIRGQLAVTAPVLFGSMHVAPIVQQFLEQHPAVEMNLILLDRVVNLLEEGMDVGVRIGALEDTSLHAINVGKVQLVCCAAPAYLERHGTPQAPHQLTQHQLINTRGLGNLAHWRFEQNGKAIQVHAQARLSINTNDAARAAAIAGFGIVRLLSYQIKEALDQGHLLPILEPFQPPSSPIHVLHRGGRFTTAKVRHFIDQLSQHLRQEFYD